MHHTTKMLHYIITFVTLTITAAYPVEHLPEGNTTNLAITTTTFGSHLVALGNNAQLWTQFTHKNGSWSEWQQLSHYCPSFVG